MRTRFGVVHIFMGQRNLDPPTKKSVRDAQKVCWSCADSVAKEFVFSQTETSINSSQSWDHTELELSGSWFCNLGDNEESPPFFLSQSHVDFSIGVFSSLFFSGFPNGVMSGHAQAWSHKSMQKSISMPDGVIEMRPQDVDTLSTLKTTADLLLTEVKQK